MFDNHRQKAALLFAAADVILTVVAFEAAYQTRAALPLERTFFITTPIKALLLGFVLVLWLVLGRWIGAYARLYGADLRAAVLDSIRQVLFGALGVAMFLFVLRLDISRPFIGLFLLYNLTLLVIYRAAAGGVRGWIRRQFGAEVFCVIVGRGAEATTLAEKLHDARDVGVRLMALVDPGDDPPESLQLETAAYPVQPLSELPQMLREHVVDEVFFVVEAAQLGPLEDVFLLCDELGVRTRVATHFFPHVNSRVYFDRFGGTPLLSFSATPHDEARLLLKRTFDVFASALALAVLAVPMLLIALGVRLSSRGPVFFAQTRCGLNGRRFRLYKFRSMEDGAEKRQAELQSRSDREGPAFKMQNDPRVTPLGKVLRRYSIDEWPQFWNVLKGDMSFVGPRPPVPEEVEQYKTWQRRRLRMRPGLTCLWAIRGRDFLDFETWMRLDLEYIDNWSLWLDLKILLQSIPLVLAGRGAH